MFVTGDGNNIIRMPFYGQELFQGFDTGWLMGEPKYYDRSLFQTGGRLVDV
jgi:hypothetical protein